jgi:hypothetical protein
MAFPGFVASGMAVERAGREPVKDTVPGEALVGTPGRYLPELPLGLVPAELARQFTG